jgi:hypothetical protein
VNGQIRVVVKLNITTTVEITDTGYLGVDATIQEHVQKATEQVRSWGVYLKRGPKEPERVHSEFRVDSIHIVPESAI